MDLTRRQLLRAGAWSAGGAAAATALSRFPDVSSAATPAALPAPAASGIEHVVVVMMENRSFDHFLGWLPGADGKQSGLSFEDRYGRRYPTFHQTNFASCDFDDPDHSYEGGRIQFNNGRCDGWLKTGNAADQLPISYYAKSDLGFLGGAAPAWTTCDRYFAAVMAETYPNRFYMHAAQTDRLHNSTAQSTLPTIWDRCSDAGVSAKYYFNDVPFTALWYTKYLSISHPYAEFLADAAAGQLPSVSFLDPRFEDEGSGTSGDDHPKADIRVGEVFLNQVYSAITSSPNWANTVLVITFDEWGGFYDHVAPGNAPDVSPTTARRGFRVPTLIISPRARRNYVAHNVYDHTSVLKMIEWRWGLKPLTPRDAAARNIAEVLNFAAPPNLTFPTFSVAPVAPTVCAPATAGSTGPLGDESTEWSAIRKVANQHGWNLPS
jgi:phospholipase C